MALRLRPKRSLLGSWVHIKEKIYIPMEMTMIHSTIRIVTIPEKRDEAETILCTVAARTRVVSGCIACRAYHDAQEDRALMLEAIWDNEEDMNRHLRSEEFRNVLLVMEMAVEQPEIRFETFSRVTGIETIKKVRSSNSICT